MIDDYIDLVLSVLFTLAAGSSLGLEVVLFGFDFSGVLATVQGFDVTVATAVAFGTLGGAWFVNQPSIDALSDEEKMLLGATAVLVVLPIVSSDFVAFVEDGGLVVALALLAVEAGGFHSVALEG